MDGQWVHDPSEVRPAFAAEPRRPPYDFMPSSSWAPGSLLETCHSRRGASWVTMWIEKGIQFDFIYLFVYISSLFQPVVTSQLGTINNLIHVKKSDFEVFDALKLDSMESSETSCRGTIVLLLPLAGSFLQCIFLPQTGFLLYFAFFCFLRNLIITHTCTHTHARTCSHTNPMV